jgi:hypothetical protein
MFLFAAPEHSRHWRSLRLLIIPVIGVVLIRRSIQQKPLPIWTTLVGRGDKIKEEDPGVNDGP